MREILFRGKRPDTGEWVEGYYAVRAILVGTIEEEVYPVIEQFNGPIHEVVPDSVGQYTGLTDKNGAKIFEGDIIKTKKFGKIIGHTNVNDFDVFVVTYENQMFRLLRKNRGFNLIDDGYSKFEVIGNICDNPELLNDTRTKNSVG